MPEYVISGVEKATQTISDRLPISAVSAISVPVRSLKDRPSLVFRGVNSDRPVLLSQDNIFSNKAKITLTGGGFGLIGVSLSGLNKHDNFSFSGGASFLEFPQRTKSGYTSNRDAFISSSYSISRHLVVVPTIKLSRSTFKMSAIDNSNLRRLTNLNINLSVNPIKHRYGTSSFFTGFTNMTLRGGGNSDFNDFSLQLNNFVKRNNISYKSKVKITTENSNSSLITFQNTVTVNPNSRFNLRAGLSYYNGASETVNNFNSVKTRIGIERKVLENSILSLSWQPEPHLTQGRGLLNKSPYLTESTSGIISEDIYNVKMEWRSYLTNELTYKTCIGWSETRHMPILNRTTVWEISSNTVRSTSYSMELEYLYSMRNRIRFSSEYHNAQVLNRSGVKALFIAPWQAILKSKNRLFKWDLKTETTWYSRTRISFESSAERPAYILASVSASKLIFPRWVLEACIDNLFNQAYWETPGYDENPLAIKININHTFGSFTND